MSWLEPPPFSARRSAMLRPVASLAVLIGWVLRALAGVLAVAVWLGATYAHVTGFYGGSWLWVIPMFFVWAFVGVMAATPLFGIGMLLVEWGDHTYRRTLPPAT